MKTKFFSRFSFIFALCLIAMFVFVFPVFAQEVDLADFAEKAGFGAQTDVVFIITQIIRIFLGFLGVIAVSFVLYGGFVFMTAGGNADRLKKAKNILKNAIIGLALILGSFTIVQFILNALTDATSADISGSSDASGSSYPDTDSSDLFYLRSVNTDCAQALQNLELQFVFSKKVDVALASQGIVIKKVGGDAVSGVFQVTGNSTATAGKNISFIPSQACAAPNETAFCFDAKTDYSIDIDATILESSSGSALTCNTTYPCTFAFTTGEGVDLDVPLVSMDAPEEGQNLYAGSVELLQATTKDDTGVSTVDFYVIDDEEPIYTADLNYSEFKQLTGGNVENGFYTNTDEEWDTSGYTTNEKYKIWARGYDCSGNDNTASAVNITLRAANCNNDVQDSDLGETDIDCGGDIDLSTYCGACNGNECTSNSECASGQCVNGACVSTPKIESVTAGDGAVGNLVTIAGEGFGKDAGIISFLGTETNDSVTANPYSCNSVSGWSDTQIIVQVPSGAVDGPLSIQTFDAQVDRTDDTHGPSIADFDVNLIVRPGMCLLDPNSATSATAINVYGNNFGATQGSSAFYFTNYEASSYVKWTNDSLTVAVPNVNAGNYRTQVFTGDYVCIDSLGASTSKICSQDSDCDVAVGQKCATAWCSETLKYCKDDEACGTDGGNCESIRVGSNEVKFTVKDVSSQAVPAIVSVDSGWKVCDGGQVNGRRCAKDEDCGQDAQCIQAGDQGPPGQYVTIYGTNFGTAIGSVYFANPDLGYEALGDSAFPASCGEDFWHDTYITIKVPKQYTNGQMIADDQETTNVLFNLYVKRADSAESNQVGFVVLDDDTPGPAICSMTPTAGPVGTDVTIYGENFGSTKGDVEFYEYEQAASIGVWENDQLSKVIVPAPAQTGPVYVFESTNGYSSNSLNFAVGDCREDESLCEEGEFCCEDGSCAADCAAGKTVAAHYAYMVSTGIIPATPKVLVQCDATMASPTPWEGWSQPEDICLNAVVHADFNMAMDTTTLVEANIKIEKCDAFDTVEKDVCKTWALQTGSLSKGSTSFSWAPTSGMLLKKTLYRVTLLGGQTSGAGIKSVAGVFMSGNYVWEFTTGETEFCEVGGLNMSPLDYTATQAGKIDYLATLVAQGDQCVALSCSRYSLKWESNFSGAVIVTPTPAQGVCTDQVDAKAETPAEDPADIKATVMNAPADPSGSGELTINFTDPKVKDYFPDCSQACVNALPWAQFNVPMNSTSFTTASVFLYECRDSLCSPTDISKLNLVEKVSYNTTTNKVELVFASGQTLLPQKWYRVVLDADAILATNGNALSESGSNYGSDANRYFVDDFSWVFRTKEDGSACSIDSVAVTPEEVVARYVGDRAELSATAYGAPDDCSLDGQTLQSGSYAWSAWGAQDSPNAVGDAKGTSKDQDDIVAYMIADGAIKLTNDLPTFCTSSCLNTGSSVTIDEGVCGNGVQEASEECDNGNTLAGDGCSPMCLFEGMASCSATVTVNCCGNGIRETGATGAEDCDDKNTQSGDGCSSICLNEGARSIGSFCGDLRVDWDAQTGGEDCDNDINALSGDGCSSNCLKEGSQAKENVHAICGNGGVPESGEDCEDGNAVDDDGCSSLCLNEGTLVCESTTAKNCCGNGILETGEDCDGGADGQEGCSNSCLYEGSSYAYSVPSFCGDGISGIAEECEAAANSSFVTGDYGVSQIATGAPLEVNKETGYAVSSVSASASGKTGTASVSLQCSCTSDASCGATTTLGCGTSNCCFEKPMLKAAYPADNTASSSSSGYCRNTAVWVEFSEDMDETSFDKTADTNKDGKFSADEINANMFLDLVSVNGVEVTSAAGCPDDHVQLTVAMRSHFLARAWNFVKNTLFGIFGIEAQASSSFACYVPVSFDEVVISSGDGSTKTYRMYLRYSQLLQENAVYRLVVKGDGNPEDTSKDGVLGQTNTTTCLDAKCTSALFSQNFKVGTEVCELDHVMIEDTGNVNAADYESLSKEFFSSTGEDHLFISTPQTLRAQGATYEEISPITGSYEWSWSWGSVETDASEDDIVALASGETAKDTSTHYVAAGNNGEEGVIATATITKDELFDPSTVNKNTTEVLDVTALVCENPWPALDSSLGFPYVEDDAHTNFSFYYCRDAGEAGTDDDLPALENPIDVTSLSSSGIIQELIFKVVGSADAIGVRVIGNQKYLSPSAWFKAQTFTGSASALQLDGYEAVQAGTTVYAASANQSGSGIYPNVYVVSYNENAGTQAQNIFSQILENWKFNANDDEVSDVNLCSDGTNYLLADDGSYLSCVWDEDCLETCEESKCSLTQSACAVDADCRLGSPGDGMCDAQKLKLTRDMKRLTDLTDMQTSLQAYGESHSHCSVTKGQSCQSDANCPGTEICVLGFPDVQSGTFVPALTNSIWSSWNSSLANALGSALPTDPLNQFYNCDIAGYDQATCWNGEVGAFVCPENSHLYGYQSIGAEAYTLSSVLETSGNAVWAYDLDTDSSDEGDLLAEYPTGNAPTNGTALKGGFAATPEFCDGNTWGDSSLCGDGTQGVTEVCEIGDTKTISCTDANGVSGLMTSACVSCTKFQTETEAETAGSLCVPYACGNGTLETGEACDDGTQNGTYGHCADDCSFAGAYYCGDAYLAASEECDCGYTGIYAYSSDPNADCNTDQNSWACLNGCDTSNGQYTSDISTSCSYDCKQPGPSCGDGIVNGAEECDGGYEEWAGALCIDYEACNTDSDCATGSCGDGDAACGVGDVCTDYADAGDSCTSNAQCDSDVCASGKCSSASDAGNVCDEDTDCDSQSCPDFDYPLFSYRTCSANCEWENWSQCVGGAQICGNGIIEGAEVCDDGNSSNNDACLNTCVENVCGDNQVRSGVESCDNGSENGDACTAQYEDTCNYCNEQCQYKTRSGGYCGDGTINGNEVCDGYEVEYSCIYHPYGSFGASIIAGSCDPTKGDEQCPTGYSCRWTGVCNGGSDNGQACTLQYVEGEGVQILYSSTDANTAGCNGGGCIAPNCADNCQSQCPFAYQTTGLLVQSELTGSSPVDSVELYSYKNNEGLSPDNAVVYIPACAAATQMHVDISDENVEPPDVDIVFVTDISGSMKKNPEGTEDAEVGYRRIDYVVESTKKAIEDLFNAYEESGASLNISLVSFSTTYNPENSEYANWCESVDSAMTVEGAWTDSVLVDDYSESALLNSVDRYLSCISGSTPTYSGIKLGIDELTNSSAEVKILILLSDGEPSHNGYFNEGDDDPDDDCTDYEYSYKSDNYSGVQACVAQTAHKLIETPGILFYTAAVTTSSNLIGYMAHLSSDECEWENIESSSDCSGGYSYSASSADEINVMYEHIVDSILGLNLTLTATNQAGDTFTSTSQAQAQEDASVPLPEGFFCDSSQTSIPWRTTFNGTGAMKFSDFELTYCPYE